MTYKSKVSAPLKLTDSFVETRLDDEIVVMQIDTGDFFSLNGTARDIWQLLDGSRDKASLVEALCAKFGADRESVEADVDAFLGQLRAAGLLAGD
jgi:PqqD family protein of HPr-rel-A system